MQLPTTSRPLETWSSVVSIFPVTTGLRRGNTSTLVPSLMRSVTAAIAVSVVSESKMGKAGSTPSSMWSHTHSDSNPNSSARLA